MRDDRVESENYVERVELSLRRWVEKSAFELVRETFAADACFLCSAIFDSQKNACECTSLHFMSA